MIFDGLINEFAFLRDIFIIIEIIIKKLNMPAISTPQKRNFKVIEKIWEKVIVSMSLDIYEKIAHDLEINNKKDPTIKLHEMLNDPENTSYGPFDNVEDFLSHLHSNNDILISEYIEDYEIRINSKKIKKDLEKSLKSWKSEFVI